MEQKDFNKSDYDNIHLAIMAIEKGARLMNVPSKKYVYALEKTRAYS